MPEDILTVPCESAKYTTNLVTGNEYLAMPEINPKNCGLHSLNVLHMGARGLVEFCGKASQPLVEPFIKVDGRQISLGKRTTWSYRSYWLPVFFADCGGLAVSGTIFAPPGHRGAVYLLELENKGGREIRVECGFKVSHGAVKHSIFTSREVEGDHTLGYDAWTKSLVIEGRVGVPLAALAFGFNKDGRWEVQKGEGKAVAAKTLTLVPRARETTTLYIAANIESAGAGTTVVDLRRHGVDALLAETLAWLGSRVLPLKKNRALANRNLFFNYFFALGRTVDTDELVPVTSRSPRYYVSAAFWGRDCLLWSFPGLLLADTKTARALLLAVFSRHMERAGEHAHYINGVLLYPGFELDQLAAYPLALKAYLDRTGDITILKERVIRKGVREISSRLLAKQDPKTGLYSTFLDPSDDPVRYPYLIYDNALAQRALVFLAALQRKRIISGAPDFKKFASQLRLAILRHGVVDGPFGPMFAWSVDGSGNCELYDNPPGSLQLLLHYGFCLESDPAYQNTVHWVHSHHNPYYSGKGQIKEAASRHAANPWPLAAANDLLGLNLGQGKFFDTAVLDSGFCCETVEPVKGRAATGQAFASAAGFLAYALWRAFGEEKIRRNDDE